MARKKTKRPDSSITTGDISNASGIAIGHGAQVHNITNIISAADSVFRSLHQLPQPPADFTGREELIDLLLADFEKGKGAAITSQPIHGLTGMGGIGKTALGLVVAHRAARDYPDAQIFLNLKGTTAPLSAVDVMRHVILSFEPEWDLRALDEGNISDAYQSVLHGRKVLLFFDNARSAGQVAPLRPPGTCAMLVTSRWAFGLPGLQTRRLDVMSAESARAFVLELCPRIDTKAADLAEACARLPLALRIAGSFLQVNPDWSVDKYLARLIDRKSRLSALKESRQEAELTTEPDLLATFELSYHGLSEEDRKHWRTLGVFPASFTSQAAGALWGLEEEETGKLLSLFLRYSLLDYDEGSSRYSLHDLLADYALSQMGAGEEQRARLQHASYYKDMLSAADDLYLQGGEQILTGLRLFDLEWENIRAGQAWAAASRGKDPALAKLCITYPGAGPYILSLRQHPKEQIRWLEAGLSAAREIDDRRVEGAALNNLGIAYRELGDAHKAIEYHEQHLAIAREIGDRRGEGAALGNLGTAYKNLGEVHKAIEYYGTRLAIARETGDRRGEGNALGNLGNAYSSLGEVHKAIEYSEQALAIAREIGDRHGEANALGNLGNVYRGLGEVHKAIEYYEQSLTIAREIGDRRGEGATLGNLGNAYADLGEVHKAIEYYETRLAIAREIGHRQGEGNALGNLGIAYGDLGEVHKAIEFNEQALVIDREIGDRQGEALDSWNLGLAYEKIGKLNKAVKVMQMCVDFEREIGHPDAEKDAAKVEGLRQRLRDQGETNEDESGQG